MAATLENFEMHLVPGGTTGINAKPAGVPIELTRNRVGSSIGNSTWDFVVNNLVPSATIINDVNVAKRLAGWKVRSSPVTSEGVAGIGLFGSILGGAMSTFPHIVNAVGVMNGAITDPLLVTKLGLWFLETEAHVTRVIGDATGDYAFLLSPSWNSGFAGSFAKTDGFGIAWTKGTGDNYQLFIANQALDGQPYFAIIDTGIKAVDETHHIRVEWGYDIILSKIVIRAVIDGFTVGQLLGPFITSPSVFGNAIFCGYDGSQTAPLDTLEVFFGFGTGLKTGAFIPSSPPPPPPPPVNLNACSVIVPNFIGQSAGIIQAFQPCSGSGQPSIPGAGNCG